MGDPKRDKLEVASQRAILAGVFTPDERDACADPLAELRGLVETAGVEIVGELSQFRRKPDVATLMGTGKVKELQRMVEALDAQLVIFDNGLSPSQGRNLEQELNRVIVDRSEVILDIFASRARTYEARLQVELAQQLYFRPRLKRMWTHLERIEGGVGAARGPGEKQIETDRRLIDKRIDELKRKLQDVEKHRQRIVSQRTDHRTVSLVGYTNAGKSTLLNSLTGADEYAADQLFATLDTRTRRWTLPHLGDVLLSDTVGFIRKLPHHLVASFRSTLEEARYADLLLHVVDASHPEAGLQVETVHSVLDSIGVAHANMVLVLNKADAVQDQSVVDVLRLKHEDCVLVSARDGRGLDELAALVADRLGDGFVAIRIDASAADGRLHHFLARHAEVTNTSYENSAVLYECQISRQLLPRLREFDATVTFAADGRPCFDETPEWHRSESESEISP